MHIDLDLRFHRDSHSVEIIGTTDEELSLDMPYRKLHALGTSFIVKANSARPSTIRSTLRWLEVGLRDNAKMSPKDREFVRDVLENRGGEVTIRYWYGAA